MGKKDSGNFTIFLKWAMERLEKKTNKQATECLMAACYQYSPKVVLSWMEKQLLDPEDPKQDPFKNEKNWSPVIKFFGDVVQEFGVHNVYVSRMVYLIHQKIAKCKKKDDCYHALAILHQQLGDEWKAVLEAPLSSSSKKAFGKLIDKKIKKEKYKPGEYVQLRCTKKESEPKPVGGEMEEYEETVEEWIEIKPEAPPQAAAVQPAADQKAAEPT